MNSSFWVGHHGCFLLEKGLSHRIIVVSKCRKRGLSLREICLHNSFVGFDGLGAT